MITAGVNKNKRILSLLNKEKGFALVIAILVMVLLTVMGLGILVITNIESKISDNFRSHNQALYIAESGIERAISYFNNPASFTDVSGSYSGYAVSSVSDAQMFFAKRRLVGIVPSYFNSSNLSQFEDTDNDGVIDSPPHDHANPVLKYNRDTNEAQKNFLESISPNVSDQSYIYELMLFAPPYGSGAVATVRVTSKVRNASRTVEQILMPGPIIAFTSGLASGAGAAWNGNSLSVHWGSVLIQGTTATISNPLSMNPARTVDADIDAGPYTGAGGEDRWLRAFVNGLYDGPPYDDPLKTKYYIPPDELDEQNIHPYYTPHYNLFSNQSITIDHWDYAEAKRIAQRYGTYYTTDASGNLYLDGEGSPLNFKSITNTKSCGIVFVDTIDQLPPSGSNLATISFSGDYYTSGIFYMAANLSTAGLGSGATKTVLAPPILQARGSINQGTTTLTVPTDTTAGMKAGDIILIGRKIGTNYTFEELKITNVVDATTLTVASTTDRFGYSPGTTPAEFNHNNENFIITTTTDETTRQAVSGFDYNFSGAFYCAGQVDMQGGPRFFGTIIAEDGYAAGGNPEVWYNWNLSKSDLTEYGIPNVVRGAWREIY